MLFIKPMLIAVSLGQVIFGTGVGGKPTDRREPLVAESLDDLLQQIVDKSGTEDLVEALYDDKFQSLESREDYQRLRRKLKALDALYRYGTRVALPVIRLNYGIDGNDCDGVGLRCALMLLDFEDITSKDIRSVVEPEIRKGKPAGGSLLQKDYDIHNLPLIIQSIKLERHPAYKQSLRVALRNVIFGQYQSREVFLRTDEEGRTVKSRLFPYTFDDYDHLDDEDLDKILEIYEKNKKRIPNADPPKPQRSPVT